MQWDDQCLDSLYFAPLTNDTVLKDICRCPSNASSEAALPWADGKDASLKFGDVDDDGDGQEDSDMTGATTLKDDNGIWRLSVASLPATFQFTVESLAPPCADILEATVMEWEAATGGPRVPLYTVTQAPTPAPTHEPTAAPTGVAAFNASKSDGPASTPGPTPQLPPPFEPFRRAAPARVLARADGTYRITATVTGEGDHDIVVRLAYRRWVPRTACRTDSCREVYDVPDATNYTKPFPFITKQLHVKLLAQDEAAAAAPAATATTRALEDQEVSQ